MRISDWSSDVCSSDLLRARQPAQPPDLFDGGHRLPGLRAFGGALGEVFGPEFAELGPAFNRLIQRVFRARGAAQHGQARAKTTKAHQRGLCDELAAIRSEERRGGKAGVSQCRSRWSPDHSKKKQDQERKEEAYK